MTRMQCSICLHPQRAVIDDCLKNGIPLRELARRHAPLTLASLQRHRVNHLNVESSRPATNAASDEVLHALDALLGELQRAQARAKRRRNSCDLLKVARELRPLLALRAKLGPRVTTGDNAPTTTVVEEELCAQCQKLRAMSDGGIEQILVDGAIKNTVVFAKVIGRLSEIGWKLEPPLTVRPSSSTLLQ